MNYFIKKLTIILVKFGSNWGGGVKEGILANLATISFSRENLLHIVSQVCVYPVIPTLPKWSIRTQLQNVDITSNMRDTCRAELSKTLIIAHRIDNILRTALWRLR